MPGELRNCDYEDYRTYSHIHIRASGQMSLEDLRRELVDSGELAKEIMSQEVDLDLGED